MLAELAQGVAAADADDFWIWTIILAISVGVSFVVAFKRLRHARLIEDTPTSKVRSANQGYVELEGIARLIDEEIVCPLTNTTCLWWFYQVEEERGSGKNKSWVTIDKGTSEAPFYLEDATGRCVVHPGGAEVIPGLSRTWYGSSARPMGPPRGGSGWFTVSSGRYRYSERFLFRDQPIYALGLFSTETAEPGMSIEQVVQEKLSQWKQDPQRMAMFDVNRDGKVDLKEWEAARRVARTEAEREQLARPLDAGVDILSKPPLSDQPYMLSATLQKQLCRRFRRQSVACYAWFVGGGAFLVWLLLARGAL